MPPTVQRLPIANDTVLTLYPDIRIPTQYELAHVYDLLSHSSSMGTRPKSSLAFGQLPAHLSAQSALPGLPCSNDFLPAIIIAIINTIINAKIVIKTIIIVLQ